MPATGSMLHKVADQSALSKRIDRNFARQGAPIKELSMRRLVYRVIHVCSCSIEPRRTLKLLPRFDGLKQHPPHGNGRTWSIVHLTMLASQRESMAVRCLAILNGLVISTLVLRKEGLYHEQLHEAIP